MNLGDDQLLDLKDSIIAAFRPMESLFRVMGSASVDEGGETARLCSEIGQELAQGFRAKLDAAGFAQYPDAYGGRSQPQAGGGR